MGILKECPTPRHDRKVSFTNKDEIKFISPKHSLAVKKKSWFEEEEKEKNDDGDVFSPFDCIAMDDCLIKFKMGNMARLVTETYMEELNAMFNGYEILKPTYERDQ